MKPKKPLRQQRPVKKGKKAKPVQKSMRLPRVGAIVLFVIFALGAMVVGQRVHQELTTSLLQSQFFSRIASEIRFQMQDGPNPYLYTPNVGPYNQRLGYSYIPFFTKSLSGESYEITQQMRASIRYHELLGYGLYPIYRAKTVAGISLADRNGAPLYNASYPTHIFESFSSVPPLLLNTLLWIENRELLKDGAVTRNPVVEWDRLFLAVIARAFGKVAPGINTGGGSTLATQLEKFRFSPDGMTKGVKDKLYQLLSASIQAYMDGPDTRAVREKIALDYLNSTPLSARAGFGEVNGIGDGLWVWYGRDLAQITAALTLPEKDVASLQVKAQAYRECLSLILAQRRPTAYLLTNRKSLDELVDAALDRLAEAGVISTYLRDAARASRLTFLSDPPAIPPQPFIDQKAANALRTHLMQMLGLQNLYELDRVDLSAMSTLDQEAQKKVADFLKKMHDKDFVSSIGMFGFRLLNPENDLTPINWSVVLYERTPNGNRLRVQADNIDGPFDMNEGVKLDLGSTAKLRTLVTYLEIIGELHRRYAGLSAEDLADLKEESPDNLTTWAITWLLDHPDASLGEMLEGAMDRKYSGSPNEVFFTGGGAHTFVNFEKSEDFQTIDVREAFRHSVNLVFIRLMRDIVNYTIGQGEQTKQEILGDTSLPERRAYLERYADQEGSIFLSRYIADYANLSPEEILARATAHAHKGATARTILFNVLFPKAGYPAYVAYMKKNMATELDADRLKKLYTNYPASKYSLSDQAYITGLNPMELWLAAYLQNNPNATRSEILSVSKPMRIESYSWLFHPKKKGAQDTRIRIILEEDAFTRIQQRWARLGYPFSRLVPSYATAIGSSADRPGALAELAGILLNDGVKLPTIRFEEMHFAADTPYETVMKPRQTNGEQVLDPAIASVVRKSMLDVVENGTAKRLFGAYKDAADNQLPVGGKTGTGDHRYEEFGAGGRVISSRVVNRTGTIVFFIGDKWFGTVTAHVAGEQAANYKFTSALSAQMLRALAPALSPLVNGGVTAHPAQ